jgi:hypothetical protein
MNREQAIRAVADKIGLSGPFTNNLVDAMEAVGVLKLEKPVEPAGLVCTATAAGKPNGHCAYVRLDVMVEALRLAGYEVHGGPVLGTRAKDPPSLVFDAGRTFWAPAGPRP